MSPAVEGERAIMVLPVSVTLASDEPVDGFLMKLLESNRWIQV